MTKKVKNTSSKPKKQSTPVKATAPAPPAPALEPKVEEQTTSSLNDSFTELLGQLSALRGQLTTITGAVRSLQRRSERDMKQALKVSKKNKRKNMNRAPSGFVKPTKISQELATFLGKPKGTEMARTEVTREINSYIREHKLQDPSNGRKILADTKLRKLLKLQKSDELTYFNLQKFMSPHFAKKGEVAFDSN